MDAVAAGSRQTRLSFRLKLNYQGVYIPFWRVYSLIGKIVVKWKWLIVRVNKGADGNIIIEVNF